MFTIISTGSQPRPRPLYRLVVACACAATMLCAPASGVAQPRATLKIPGNLVMWIAFSPDGKTLAAAGGNGVIYLWDVPPLKP